MIFVPWRHGVSYALVGRIGCFGQLVSDDVVVEYRGFASLIELITRSITSSSHHLSLLSNFLKFNSCNSFRNTMAATALRIASIE